MSMNLTQTVLILSQVTLKIIWSKMKLQYLTQPSITKDHHSEYSHYGIGRQ
jgi:hypothetical protein